MSPKLYVFVTNPIIHSSIIIKKDANKNNFAPIVSVQRPASLKYFQENKADSVKADFSFQSRVRWTLENKRSYMTSLVLGMAPSKFILADTEQCGLTTRNTSDIKYYDGWRNEGVNYINVDSNNRVTTIAEYYNNQFGLEISRDILEIRHMAYLVLVMEMLQKMRLPSNQDGVHSNHG